MKSYENGPVILYLKLTNHVSHQKRNPSRETVPFGTIFIIRNEAETLHIFSSLKRQPKNKIKTFVQCKQSSEEAFKKIFS
jgi:hypothetical protein